MYKNYSFYCCLVLLLGTGYGHSFGQGMEETNRQRITTSGPQFYTTTNYIYETDVFMLNLGFNLNKLTRKLKLPGSEFGEKEF
jgi:hypothetical protein